jgi:uncharacterized protein YcgL (UPF0745 family)
MFKVVEKTCQFISCLLASTKYDFSEVDKAMFHGFDTPRFIFVCLLTYIKCDLEVVEKAMFQMVD